jgi:hypothetical protein
VFIQRRVSDSLHPCLGGATRQREEEKEMLFLRRAAGLRFRFQVLGVGFARATDIVPKLRPWPRSYRCIAWFSVCGAVALLIALRPSPAGASCTPDPANSGDTVTCSGADNNGFNSASTNLTVDVLSGASVSVGNGLGAIGLSSGNTITNDGSIAAGALGSGILANANNMIINNGSIIAGANGFSIQTIGTGNTVINNGTLDGILSLAGANNSITNWGLITITNAGTPVGASHVVGGDYIQMSWATLASRVNTASADTLSVSGTATLNGTLRITVQPGLYGNSTNYLGVINAANPIVTQFETQSSSSAFLTASTIYNANSVDVVLTRIPFGAVAGLSPNQQAVGNALEKVYSPSVSGGAAALYSNLLAVSSPLVLNQLSGEGITAAQQSAFLANSQFVSLLSGRMTFDPARAVFNAPAGAVHALGYSAESTAGYDGVVTPPPLVAPYGPPPPPRSWAGWGAAFGGRQTISGDSINGSVSQDSNVLGGAIGGELRTEFGNVLEPIREVLESDESDVIHC